MSGTRSTWTRVVPAIAVAALLVAGCGSSKSESASGSTSAPTVEQTTVAAGPLRILVTNDDGYDAKGIDAVVEALKALPDTEVTVVAPLTNQSGVGGKVTDGPLVATDVTTLSGYPAKAIAGTPADTIIWAIDQHGIDFTPDLVVAGLNFGQNLTTPVVNISGTVGAARAAGARGIPALASSQGLGDPADFPAGVKQVLSWLDTNRDAVASGAATSPLLLESLNVPTCTAGSVRGLVKMAIDPKASDTPLGPSDCTSTATGQSTDIEAFTDGFATLSTLPLTPA